MLQGGDGGGEFKITGDITTLAEYFYTWLGLHVEEKTDGIVTYAGKIMEMEFSDGNITWRFSLKDVFNNVMCRYRKKDSHPLTYTDWETNDNSVARYGRQDAIITSPKNCTLSQANVQRNEYLEEKGQPIIMPVSTANKISLVVRCVGYRATMTQQYIDWEDYDRTEGNRSAHVKSIIEATSEIVTTCYILDTDTFQIADVVSKGDKLTLWEFLSKRLMEDNNDYRIYVKDRTAYYEVIGTTPDFYMRRGKIFQSPQATTPIVSYAAKPGIYRDMDYPVIYALKGARLSDPRDMLITQVMASKGGKLEVSGVET